MLVDDGMTQGHPVVPEAWLAGTGAPEPDVREAFAVTDDDSLLGGRHPDQFWVLPGSDGPVLVCLGIHGQLIYADRAARTVVVKLVRLIRRTRPTCWIVCATMVPWPPIWRPRALSIRPVRSSRWVVFFCGFCSS